MAAGESKRMGSNKLFLPYKGKPLIHYTFELTQRIDFFESILVLSPQNAKMLSYYDIPKKVKVVYNHNMELGQSHSVVLGTKEARGDGYLFLMGDQPLLTVEIIQEILAKAAIDKIVFPLKEDGQPSSPTFFGGNFREELLSVTGEYGGRQIREKYPESCLSFNPKDSKQLIDIDTPEKYEGLGWKI